MKITKDCKLKAVYFKEGAFAAQVGVITKIDATTKNIEAYLQPDSSVYCESKTEGFLVPHSNIRNSVFNKEYLEQSTKSKKA